MEKTDHICRHCALNKPWGCGTPIREVEVVKGVGAVGCKRYERDEKKAKWYGK